MVRTFVALELSDEIRARLTEAQVLLKRCSARMTYVEPKNIHITVKFLGEVEIQRIPDVIAALSSIPFGPFPVSAAAITLNETETWCRTGF
jgi:2'-5' RNA ligase